MYTTTLSALIYLGSFIYPNYMGIGVFVWMLPLIVTDKYNNAGFKAGCTWGLIFFSGHLYWVAKFSFLAYIAIVSYFSILSGLWIWCKKLTYYRLVRNLKNHNGKCAASCCTWVISTATFIYLTCYCSLAIFDCFEGYPLMNPLLPIVSWSWYLAPIYYFGTIPYWLIIMTINTILAQLIIKYDTKTLIFLLLLIAFPIAFQPVSQKIINNNNGFFYIQPTWNDNSLATASEKFYAISKKIDDIALANKTIHTIVMPEGSFGHDILVWQEYLDAWTGLLPATTSIIIGTHRRVEDALYNSLVQIQDGKIIGWYDKEHLMFFGERQPWIVQLLPSFKGLFGEHSFTYPCRNQSEIRIDGFIPMICSELFCKEKRPSCVDSPILFVCHDGWFTMHYAQDLALRAAQLYSLRYRVPIVYVGSNAMHFMQM